MLQETGNQIITFIYKNFPSENKKPFSVNWENKVKKWAQARNINVIFSPSKITYCSGNISDIMQMSTYIGFLLASRDNQIQY